MGRDARYDPLFEPIRIGPVTAKNRFFQVPHCNGMGHAMPQAHAAMREVKAEGGWAVVSTEECEIHPSGDVSPYVEARLWDDHDIPALQLMCEKVHAHGALAAIELTHNGPTASNLYSRDVLLAPSHQPSKYGYPNQARAMTLQDIADYRRWHRAAALRAKKAGFDIIYVYAGMGYLPYEFLLPEYNHRNDAYGGSIQNRVRLVAELLQVTRDAVGHKCGVALRISLEELRGRPGTTAESEAHEVIALLSEHTDLFDVKMDSSPTDCAPSRFSPEGSHEPIINFVKKVTDKPVVGVGRFTSPDVMVSQIKRGVLDLIGGARPSIADPFLPAKINEGREHEIRECIGCNICISSWHDGVPVRCTQNPTAGEEWRRGWHPERFEAPADDSKVLIVGAGPAGLECAVTLARRGYQVTIADSAEEFGGRLRFETSLPGLKTWGRVVDWRMGQLRERANVSMYPGSTLSVDDIVGLEHEHVVVATGARWTKMLFSTLEFPVGELDGPAVFTPDDVAAGVVPEGPVVVFDFDNYYMGGVLAEHLAKLGRQVSYVTTGGQASSWTLMTNELPLIHRALAKANVPIHTLQRVIGFDGEKLELAEIFSGVTRSMECKSLVIVGVRKPRDTLYQELDAHAEDLKDAGIASITRIGDAHAPGAIVHAVHSGHKYARELGATLAGLPYQRDFQV